MYPWFSQPILDVVADNCIEIAMDKSGCCALQHCVGYAEGVYKKRLADQITSNALTLSEHSFGFVPIYDSVNFIHT